MPNQIPKRGGVYRPHRYEWQLGVVLVISLCLWGGHARAQLAAPTDLQGAGGTDRIRLTWTASTSPNADSTRILYTSNPSLFDVDDTIFRRDASRTDHPSPASPFTLLNLTPNTDYRLAIMARDSTTGEESGLSNRITVSTTSLPTPTDLTALLSLRSDDALVVRWTPNDAETGTIGYTLFYRRSDEGVQNEQQIEVTRRETSTATLEGLEANTRYVIAIAAVNDAEEVSTRSAEVVVDTLQAGGTSDGLPPNTPSGVSLAISGQETIDVAWTGENDGMVDLKQFVIRVGTAAGRDDVATVTVARGVTTTAIRNMPANTLLFVAVAAEDEDGNRSAFSDEETILVEQAAFVFFDDDGADCFIAALYTGAPSVPSLSLLRRVRDRLRHLSYLGLRLERLYYEVWSPRLNTWVNRHPAWRTPLQWLLLPPLWVFGLLFGTSPWLLAGLLLTVLVLTWQPALRRWAIPVTCLLLWGTPTPATALDHQLGGKVSFLLPAEERWDDVYGSNNFQFHMEYRLHVTPHLGFNLSAGFEEETGKAITASKTKTAIDTTLRLVPLSAGLLVYPFTYRDHYLAPYVGGGLDYWYFSEKGEGLQTVNGWKSGYHVLVGLALPHLSRPRDGSSAPVASFERSLFDRLSLHIETGYYSINSFGTDKRDLGGWLFSLGIFYHF